MNDTKQVELLSGTESEWERRVYNAKHGLDDAATGGNLAERDRETGRLCDALGANYDDPDADKPLPQIKAREGTYADHAVGEMEDVGLLYEGHRLPKWIGPVPRERGSLCWPAGWNPRDEPADVRECGQPYRVVEARPSRVPRAVPFAQIIELWAAHEVGTLKRIVQRHNEGGEDGYGVDEAREAWEWVARTPGWNATVREVMLHLEVRQKGWDEWPVAHCEKAEIRGGYVEQWCVWPPFGIPLETAQAAYLPFYRELRKRYRLEPFTIFVQSIELA